MNPFYRKSLLFASLVLLSAPLLFAVDYDKEGQKPAREKAVQAEAGKLASEARQRIAVLDFKTVGESTDLGEGAAEILRTTLMETGNYTVVERSMLKQVLGEQKLSASGVMDQATALEIGKILSVKLVAVGSVVKLGETYTLNVRFINVETGEVVLGKKLTSQNREEIPALCEKMVKTLSKRDASQEVEKAAPLPLKSADEDSKEITYAQILERPDDPELNYAYSKTQVRKGDLKGAAGTLERMLMVNPGLHNIRLFYAVVLFRLDNAVEALRELESLKKANPPEAVKNEAEIYLKVIKKRQKRTQASGSLSAGVEYDSNRNASPSSQTRLFLDTPLQLSGDSRKRKDSAYLMTGTAEVRRAVGARGKHEVSGSATCYGADQTHVRTVNLRAWVFRLNGTYKAPFAEITPGLIYDRVTLAGRHFLKNTGASLRLDRKLNKKTDALLETKYVYQDNVATPNVSSNPERRGGLYSVSAGVGRILNPVMKLNMDIGVSYKRAKKKYNSFNGVSLGLRHAWLLGRGMFLLSSVSAERDEYSQADTILSATTRSDDILRGGLLYGIPVSTLHSRLKNLKDLTLTVNCEQLRSKSSVLNYTYINNKAALMLTYRWEMGI